MGRKCVVNACSNRLKKHAPFMFHRFPARPGQVLLWLTALNTDPNTPIEVIKRMSICSEHFTRDDYCERMQHSSQNGRITKITRLFLRDTAVPSVDILSGATPPLPADHCKVGQVRVRTVCWSLLLRCVRDSVCWSLY